LCDTPKGPIFGLFVFLVRASATADFAGIGPVKKVAIAPRVFPLPLVKANESPNTLRQRNAGALAPSLPKKIRQGMETRHDAYHQDGGVCFSRPDLQA
jgi:hypothetical protein